MNIHCVRRRVYVCVCTQKKTVCSSASGTVAKSEMDSRIHCPVPVQQRSPCPSYSSSSSSSSYSPFNSSRLHHLSISVFSLCPRLFPFYTLTRVCMCVCQPARATGSCRNFPVECYCPRQDRCPLASPTQYGGHAESSALFHQSVTHPPLLCFSNYSGRFNASHITYCQPTKSLFPFTLSYMILLSFSVF